MNKKIVTKLSLDLIMTISMIILFGYQITGNTIHEILGIGVFIAYCLHLFLNRSWFKFLLSMKKNKINMIYTVINILLCIDMLVLLVSSILISRTVFAFLGIQSSFIWKMLHISTATLGLILIGVHLGVHWGMILKAARRMAHIQSDNKVRTIIARILAILLVVYGIKASFDRNIGNNLIAVAGTHGKMNRMAPPTEMQPSDQQPSSSNQNSEDSNDSNSESHAFSGQRRGFSGKGARHHGQEQETRTFSENVEDGESLDDFLGRLHCTGCGRSCLLTNPQCGTGVSQASSATEFYQNQTGNESSSSNETNESEDSQNNNLPPQPKMNGKGKGAGHYQVDDSVAKVFLDYGGIMSIYVCGAYYTLKLINRKKKK